MAQSRQSLFFSLYLLFILISKLLLIGGVLYFISYVNNHRDFYLGLGLKEATIQQYLLIVGSLIVIIAVIGLFLRIRKWLMVYVVGKLIELIALIWALPVYVDAIGSALKGLNESLFTIFLLIAILSLWLIFMLVTISFKNLLHK
ncbi:MAG: hypothetical protein N2167_09515 [Flavobacteriales bacterium]|nr:hypothetical protein [Flavobacteriales bacterium]